MRAKHARARRHGTGLPPDGSIRAEIDRSQKSIRDLIDIVALPGVWNGRQAENQLRGLSDVLLRMLDADFVYARLGNFSSGSACQVLSSNDSGATPADAEKLGSTLRGWISDHPKLKRGRISHPLAAQDVSIAPLRFGQNRQGILIAASSRANFPTEMETLLLQVAVNQASLGLQAAERLAYKRHATQALKRHVAIRTSELTAANHELAKLKDQLAAELNAMTRLHELSTQLLVTEQLSEVLEEVLSATMEIQRADFGCVQLYDPQPGVLVMVAQRNFERQFIDYFNAVHDSTAACGRALQTHARVIIEDVERDADFAPHRAIAAASEFRAVQATPLCSSNGELLGIVSTHFREPHRPSDGELRLTDLYARHAAEVIERKRAEDERNKLASIVENSFDFIGIASLSGTALFINPAGRRLVGLTDTGPIPNDIFAYLLESERERILAHVLPIVEIEGRWDGETCFRNFTTGAMIPMLQHIFFIQESKSGRRLALATVCRDITERKRVQEELGSAQDDLAHVTRVFSMGELTSSIAHEINQPLAAIIANANASLHWLGRAAPDLAEARSSVTRIIRDSNRASEVIQHMRMLFAKATFAQAPLSLNDTIDETLVLLANELQREQIVVRTQLAAAPWSVLGDRVQLQQVILNLIINGIDAMRGAMEKPRELSIYSDNIAELVHVRVEDSGSGVRPEELDRLFDAFFTTKPQGLGLGLSISRRIIEAHGGRLWATPNADQGMSMSFSLPRLVEPQSL